MIKVRSEILNSRVLTRHFMKFCYSKVSVWNDRIQIGAPVNVHTSPGQLEKLVDYMKVTFFMQCAF